MAKLQAVRIKAILDPYPDTSFLGEYTDALGPGVIVRHYGEFYEKIPTEMERDEYGRFSGKSEPEVPSTRNEYRGFLPYAGGEKIGTPEYYKYGMQDFNRMEELNSGDWNFIGIVAEASLLTNDESQTITFQSNGLWGIESDSGDYLNEVAEDELEDLKSTLEKEHVDLSKWDELTNDLEIKKE